MRLFRSNPTEDIEVEEDSGDARPPPLNANASSSSLASSVSQRRRERADQRQTLTINLFHAAAPSSDGKQAPMSSIDSTATREGGSRGDAPTAADTSGAPVAGVSRVLAADESGAPAADGGGAPAADASGAPAADASSAPAADASGAKPEIKLATLTWDAEAETRRRARHEAAEAKKAASRAAAARIAAERAEGERLATLRYLDGASDEASASSTKPAGGIAGELAADELLRTLSQLDEQRLIGALQREDIRLVRADWLRAQASSYRIERRQALEEAEGRRGALPYGSSHDEIGGVEGSGVVVRRVGGAMEGEQVAAAAETAHASGGRRRQAAVVAASSPLLTGTEAVALLRKAQRAVAVLSYGIMGAVCMRRPFLPAPRRLRLSVPPSPRPRLRVDPATPIPVRWLLPTSPAPHSQSVPAGWLMPSNPDPMGSHLHIVRQALHQLPYIEALFWVGATGAHTRATDARHRRAHRATVAAWRHLGRHASPSLCATLTRQLWRMLLVGACAAPNRTTRRSTRRHAPTRRKPPFAERYT